MGGLWVGCGCVCVVVWLLAPRTRKCWFARARSIAAAAALPPVTVNADTNAIKIIPFAAWVNAIVNAGLEAIRVPGTRSRRGSGSGSGSKHTMQAASGPPPSEAGREPRFDDEAVAAVPTAEQRLSGAESGAGVAELQSIEMTHDHEGITCVHTEV